MAPRHVGCGWWLPGFVAERIHRDEYVPQHHGGRNYEQESSNELREGIAAIVRDVNILKESPYFQRQSDRQPMGEKRPLDEKHNPICGDNSIVENGDWLLA